MFNINNFFVAAHQNFNRAFGGHFDAFARLPSRNAPLTATTNPGQAAGRSAPQNKATEKVQSLNVEIAVISDGGGYTVPRAIRMIENTTNSKVKPINYHAPQEVNDQDLTREVLAALKDIVATNRCRPGQSRASAFIEGVKRGTIHAPISSKIIRTIQDNAQNLDCIFLPGGEDVPRDWYGSLDGNENPYVYYTSHYRALVEFALIDIARTRGIPLMGVCRGLQVTHVYHGKKLEADVPGQYGVQTFNAFDSNQKGLLNNLFKERVRGQVMHHQGVSIAEGTNGVGDLEPVTTASGLVKAAQPKHGGASPVILTQFHPEMYEPNTASHQGSNSISENNAKFIETLHQAAKVRYLKRTTITPEALVEGKEKLKPAKACPNGIAIH